MSQHIIDLTETCPRDAEVKVTKILASAPATPIEFTFILSDDDTVEAGTIHRAVCNRSHGYCALYPSTICRGKGWTKKWSYKTRNYQDGDSFKVIMQFKPHVSMKSREHAVSSYSFTGKFILSGDVIIRGDTRDIASPGANAEIKCRAKIISYSDSGKTASRVVLDVNLENRTIKWRGEDLLVLNKDDFFNKITENLNA